MLPPGDYNEYFHRTSTIEHYFIFSINDLEINLYINIDADNTAFLIVESRSLGIHKSFVKTNHLTG